MSDDPRKILGEARETVVRLKDFPTSERRDSDRDVLQAWRDRMPAPSSEQSDRPRPPSFSWSQVKRAIDDAVRNEHTHIKALLVELVAQMQADADQELERAIRTLSLEVAELRGALSELRLALADIRNKEPIPLPHGFRTGKTN